MDIKRCKPLLGTYIEVYVKSKNPILDSEIIFKEIARIEKIMSYRDINSELSHINRNAFYTKVKISSQMKEILEFALNLSKISKGIFDITIASKLVENKILPDHGFEFDLEANYKNIELDNDMLKFNKKLLIDLGGIAKGFAVDKAFDKVQEHTEELSINAGGDLRVKNWQNETIIINGSDQYGNRVIIEDKMRNQSIATSANYSKYGEIINKEKNEICKNKSSISVYAINAMTADALTKIAFISDIDIYNNFEAKALTVKDKKLVETYG